MLDLIPFACAGWQMANRNSKIHFISEGLKFELPRADSIPVTSAAVGTNQNAIRIRILLGTHALPPTPNAPHCETGGVMINPDIDPPLIIRKIVNAVRDRLGFFGIYKIVSS